MTPTRLSSIKKLLVANRGEIACRIMRTAKRMNIETAAIYSSVDKDSLHVKLADEAYYVGESEPQKSYLNQERILSIAHAYNVSAIHPGYGFLSENFEFAQRCEDEQLVFVGPNASSIQTMGIKNESKRIMLEAGVPVVPGYHGLCQDDSLLYDEANKIGYPVLIKPVSGGGGKGMRVVERKEDFKGSLESSRRESLKSFNDQSMLLEKYIVKPRHIEVQIFGDKKGNYVHLFERDCSVQRRHQKIIEEAPAPLLSKEKQVELGKQAVAAARAVNYVGAGTVEFIMDKMTGEFYFMEMNTRLQVEHPITEMITSLDLVEWQLRVATGERLPKLQDDIFITGHAFEARIYAENPEDNFLPQTGRLDYVCLPNSTTLTSGTNFSLEQVRVDTGVESGVSIPPYYDPMIAKLVVWETDRRKALEKLKRALQQYIVIGVPTNIDFLSKLAKNESFIEGDVGTDFIELHNNELFPAKEQGNSPTKIKQQLMEVLPELSASSYLLLWNSTREIKKDLISFRTVHSKQPVYELRPFFRSLEEKLTLRYESLSANSAKLLVMSSDHKVQLDAFMQAVLTGVNSEEVSVRINNETVSHKFLIKSLPLTGYNDTIVILQNGAGENIPIRFEHSNLFARKATDSNESDANPLVASAPMPGIIEKVLVSLGDTVTKGQSLAILSAMKMEYTIKSRMNGLVCEMNMKPGEFVKKASVLGAIIPSSVHLPFHQSTISKSSQEKGLGGLFGLDVKSTVGDNLFDSLFSVFQLSMSGDICISDYARKTDQINDDWLDQAALDEEEDFNRTIQKSVKMYRLDSDTQSIRSKKNPNSQPEFNSFDVLDCDEEYYNKLTSKRAIDKFNRMVVTFNEIC